MFTCNQWCTSRFPCTHNTSSHLCRSSSFTKSPSFFKSFALAPSSILHLAQYVTVATCDICMCSLGTCHSISLHVHTGTLPNRCNVPLHSFLHIVRAAHPHQQLLGHLLADPAPLATCYMVPQTYLASLLQLQIWCAPCECSILRRLLLLLRARDRRLRRPIGASHHPASHNTTFHSHLALVQHAHCVAHAVSRESATASPTHILSHSPTDVHNTAHYQHTEPLFNAIH